MKFCINDIVASKKITNNISNIKNISINSPKYTGFDTSSINLQNCRYSLIRPYAWNDWKYSQFTNLGRLKEPLCLAIYFDLLKGYLSNPACVFYDQYKDRKLLYDYDNSTVNFDMTFNSGKYNFTATMLQSIVLMTINNSGAINAQDIEKNTGVPLKTLSLIINSLIKSGLVKRDSTAQNNDPKMTFQINTQWTSDDTDFSLITVLNDIKAFLANKSKTQESNVTDELCAYVISYFATNKCSTLTNVQVLEHAKTFNAKVNSNDVETIMTRLIASQLVTKVADNTYKYNSSDDSDSDDETELDHVQPTTTSTISEGIFTAVSTAKSNNPHFVSSSVDEVD